MSEPKDAAEPTIIAHEREQLVYLLTEAAEIEHGLMCCYLYAAYSLKRSRDGLSEEEADAIGRWRQMMVNVAIDEMLHLSLVNNLLTAIGAAPHFERPNFPVAPGYHPAGVVVALAPFDRATLEHFIYLERPEGMTLPDGAGFSPPAQYERSARRDRLVPSAQDYATVGHLYRGIRAGFQELSATFGEERLFIGDPDAQVGEDTAPLTGLLPVRDLASALSALDLIVEQGEGAPEHRETSHYAVFCSILAEFDALRARRAGFIPAHPAARNPVMRKPPESAGKIYIDEPRSAALLDLGNAVYAFALRCLARAFGESDDGKSARAGLVQASLVGMHELASIMQRLAELPASPAAPGVNAGLTFTMSRGTLGFSQQRAAWLVLKERADEIARQAEGVAAEVDEVAAGTAKAFQRLVASLASAAPVSSDSAAPRGGVSLPVLQEGSSAPSGTPAPSQSNSGIEEARTDRVVLRFEGKRCIHSRQCVLGAPDVFLANVQGPWLHPEAVGVEELVAVAQACPSGAITYLRTDGGAQEKPPKVNVLRVRENGPLAVQAALEIEGRGAMLRATLCRCGASKNKPFCDGSHNPVGFMATGEPATQPSEPLGERGGQLAILPTHNGPLQVTGNLEICAGTGRTVKRVTSTWLCRCGASQNKPFCDGSHARIGFVSE